MTVDEMVKDISIRENPWPRPRTDQVMKFFTQELFIRFNSPDDEVADRADEDWEAAIREYRDYLDGFRDQMPTQVKKLASLSLHDARVLALEEPIEPFFSVPSLNSPLWYGCAILSVKQGNEIVSLIYSLWDRMCKHPSEIPWPFSKQQTYWLYDEVDVAPTRHGLFVHRVLLSDGTVIEIRFASVLIHTISLRAERPSDGSRQIA
jgi:hypothetical protein